MLSLYQPAALTSVSLPFPAWLPVKGLHVSPAHCKAPPVNVQNDVGIIRVDAQQLKAALLPSPTALLAQLGHLLPQAAGQLYSGFIDQVHNATFVLRASINSVEDYVHQLGFLETLKVLHLCCLQHMLQYHMCLLKCRHLFTLLHIISRGFVVAWRVVCISCGLRRTILTGSCRAFVAAMTSLLLVCEREKKSLVCGAGKPEQGG